MSLTIGEATAVNTVLDYWLGLPREGVGPVTDKAVFAAMLELADRAHGRLGAGVTSDQVRKAWIKRKADQAAWVNDKADRR